MRYSIELKYRKYVEGYDFLHLQKNGDNFGKKLMDTAIKTGIDVAKTAEAKADLIRKKTADKITSIGKTESKADDIDKRQEI